MIRGQRVRRVVRHIDTWSVLRVAVLFYLSLMLVIVLAGVMLWVAGSVFGAVDGVENFMRGIGFDGFRFVAGQLLRGFTAIGLILVVLGTGATVLAALLYNLIADVVGGVQLTVLEEVYVADDIEADTEADDVAADVAEGESPTWAVPEPAAPDLAPGLAVAPPEPAPVAETEPEPATPPEPATTPEPAVDAPEGTPPEGPSTPQDAEAVIEPAPPPEPVRANGWPGPASEPASRSEWVATGEPDQGSS